MAPRDVSLLMAAGPLLEPFFFLVFPLLPNSFPLFSMTLYGGTFQQTIQFLMKVGSELFPSPVLKPKLCGSFY